MIYYLATREHSYTLCPFLTYWARDFRRHLKVLTYSAIRQRSKLPPGTYIFTDVDRLTPEERAFASRLRSAMQGVEGYRTLNDPYRSLSRYGLLRTLRERGVNDFDLYRLSEDLSGIRFPVFLREENEHTGALTGILPDRASLAEAMGEFRDPAGKVVVEFSDTSDREGVYRKYAAYHVCGEVIPIHVMLSREPFVKSATLEDPSLEAEEREYLEANPHAGRIRDLFRLARIDYGRIDYGLRDGELRVWEINTNPCLLPLRNTDQRRELKEHFLVRFRQALADVDAGTAAATARPIPLEKAGRLAWWPAVRERTLDWYYFNRYSSNPGIRPINGVILFRRRVRKSIRGARRKVKSALRQVRSRLPSGRPRGN